MRSTEWLSVAARIVAAVSVLTAAISIVARWPHQFGGRGDRNHMMADFANSGTALAPPLVILVVFVTASVLVGRLDRWGATACIVVLVVSIFMIVGAVGEGTAAATSDVPRAVQVFSGIWGAVAGTVLIALSAASLKERWGIRAARLSRETA